MFWGRVVSLIGGFSGLNGTSVRGGPFHLQTSKLVTDQQRIYPSKAVQPHTLRFLVDGRVGEESGASASEVSCSWISLRRARRRFDSGIFDQTNCCKICKDFLLLLSFFLSFFFFLFWNGVDKSSYCQY